MSDTEVAQQPGGVQILRPHGRLFIRREKAMARQSPPAGSSKMTYERLSDASACLGGVAGRKNFATAWARE